jgi:hypothetical protein
MNGADGTSAREEAMAETSGKTLAEFVIAFSREHGDSISNLGAADLWGL